MTKISKVFVILTMIASMTFLGVTAAGLVGGHNWQAEIEELPDFVFEKNEPEGAPVTWTVRTRRPVRGPGGGPAEVQTVASGAPHLPDAVLKARQFQVQAQEKELEQLNTNVPQVEARLKEARELIAADLQALRRRDTDVEAELQALADQIEEITREAIAKAEEAHAIRTETERRREDVFRLRNQVADLRADKFRILEQQKKLRDLLLRIEGDAERLERRRQDLVRQGGKLPYEEPATSPDT